jgi:L-threonylcarbamoyladenylate synthase
LHVYEDLNDKIPLIIDGGTIEYGLESTVIDCTDGLSTILRPGSVTKEMLQLVILDVTYSKETAEIRSPGMRHQHYAPQAPIILFIGEPNKTAVAIAQYANQYPSTAIIWHTGELGSDVTLQHRLPQAADEAAPMLFGTLRALDRQNPSRILVQGYDTSGIGAAVMNRLEKAASKIIVV